MMLFVLRQSTSSRALRICALAWTVWPQSLNHRPEAGHMCRTPCIFSAEGGQTASRGLYGKAMGGSCYINGCQKAGSSGREARKKCDC